MQLMGSSAARLPSSLCTHTPHPRALHRDSHPQLTASPRGVPERTQQRHSALAEPWAKASQPSPGGAPGPARAGDPSPARLCPGSTEPWRKPIFNPETAMRLQGRTSPWLLLKDEAGALQPQCRRLLLWSSESQHRPHSQSSACGADFLQPSVWKREPAPLAPTPLSDHILCPISLW